MIAIPLTKGYTAIVDNEDADLAAFKWQAQIHPSGNVIARRGIQVGPKVIAEYMHRVIAERMGAVPDKARVRHDDDDGLNNRRSNLRITLQPPPRQRIRPDTRPAVPDAVLIPEGLALIPLTKGHIAVIDECDTDLNALKWCAREGDTGVWGVRGERVDGKLVTIKLHNVIMERMIGRTLAVDERVDHVDCNGLNNRRENLRIATHQQNMMNRRVGKHNRSGYKGVSKKKAGWTATITVSGKQHYLGLFRSPELAHNAYVEAAKQYFGEFAHDGFRSLKDAS
jgi:hypothetical protein